MWAHLVYGGRLDMEVEGCGLVAVGDHAGGVDLVLDLVGMVVESMVVDLAGLIRGPGLAGTELGWDGTELGWDGTELGWAGRGPGCCTDWDGGGLIPA